MAEYMRQLQEALTGVYDAREAGNIARYVLEEKYGRIKVRENGILSEEQLEGLGSIQQRLVKAERCSMCWDMPGFRKDILRR
ncbi:MAG: hypothetical protein R2794_08120 [Chitinophagales bacterium]